MKRIDRHARQIASRKRLWRNIAGGLIIALLLFGVFVVLNFNKLQGDSAHYVQESVLKTPRKQTKQKIKPSFNFAAVKPVSPATIAFAYAHRRDARAIGQIAIPKWGINLNIYRGVGNLELNLGAGTMRPDEVMGQGNYALAGHNMDDNRSFFSPLYNAKVHNWLGHDTVIMITDYDTVWYYRVEESAWISRYQTDLIEDSPKFLHHPVVSLFTCDATGRGRLFVRGKLTGYQKLHDASSVVNGAFTMP